MPSDRLPTISIQIFKNIDTVAHLFIAPLVEGTTMQSRRQLYPTFVAAAVIAGTLLAVVLAMSAGPAGAHRPDPASRLQCSGDRFIATRVTHDNVTKEARTPEQLADSWAAAMTAQRKAFQPAGRVNAFTAADVRDVVFVNDAKRVISVLSYERDADLGWRIESIVECA